MIPCEHVTACMRVRRVVVHGNGSAPCVSIDIHSDSFKRWVDCAWKSSQYLHAVENIAIIQPVPSSWELDEVTLPNVNTHTVTRGKQRVKRLQSAGGRGGVVPGRMYQDHDNADAGHTRSVRAKPRCSQCNQGGHTKTTHDRVISTQLHLNSESVGDLDPSTFTVHNGENSDATLMQNEDENTGAADLHIMSAWPSLNELLTQT